MPKTTKLATRARAPLTRKNLSKNSNKVIEKAKKPAQGKALTKAKRATQKAESQSKKVNAPSNESEVENLSTGSSNEGRRSLPLGTLVMDGATGSELDRKGVDCSRPLWSCNANLKAPEVLKQVHREYLLNGAKAITTNTFRTHEHTLKKAGLGHLAKQLTTTAVEMAVAARDEVNPDALVLGSVAPLENCYKADLAPSFAYCKREHKKIMTDMLEAGVDFIVIETCCSGQEAIAAAQVANELAPGHWGIAFSVPEDTVGILRCGTPLADIIDNFKDAAFIGINCMDGRTITKQVKHLKKIAPEGMRLAAYGNIGVWSVTAKDYSVGGNHTVNNEVEHDAMYVKFVKEWLDAGASIVGGCCGTTPNSIRMLYGVV